jgi:fatty-acyl-CoA synthase
LERELRRRMHAADLLSKRAHLTPEREAVFEQATGRRCTYAELNERACRLANFLHDRLGIRKGDRVSIIGHNSLVYLDLLYGLAKIGAIFAPLNWRLTARELAYIANDCSPRLLLCGPEFVGVLEELRMQVSIEQVIALEGAEIEGSIAYEEMLASSSPGEPVRPPIDEEDPYCLLYTSGTTGHPKGAILPHRQILWNCINTVISWGLDEQEVTPIFTPLFHAGGLFAFLTPVLYAGGRAVLARTFDPDDSLRTIQEEKCTVILGVPTLFQMWMASPVYPEADFSKVRFFISGGAACPVSLMKAWRQEKGVVFRQGYGLTEVGTNCFSMTDEESIRKAGSVGKPIFHSEMRLVDPDSGMEAKPGQAGELLIRGPHVCSGYWGNLQATIEALRDGWFHTGDMATRDAEGFYSIAGRYKDMIKTGGENVYAAEVEAVFREHPAVGDAALIGIPDDKWGEIGQMVVALKPNAAAGEVELLEHCQGRLARFKIPKRIVFVSELPYSPYGKVMKSELKKNYLRSKR